MNQGCHPKTNKLLLLTTGGTIASLPDHPTKTHLSAQELLDRMESVYPVLFCGSGGSLLPRQRQSSASAMAGTCPADLRLLRPL